MKVILSRKGFDSKYGGIPSPIMPDGMLLSLPIPHNDGRAFSELRHNGETYADIRNQLGGKDYAGKGHLDPDIRQGAFDSPSNWKPAFGQSFHSQTHLKNQGVGTGDVFLFFGWFRQTERIDGKLRYVRKAPHLHIIYGYLQVGEILTDKADIQAYSWHPHVKSAHDNNCLYIPSDTLSWGDSKAGYGVFQYGKELVLTKEGMTRSRWRLPNIPAFAGKPTITGALADPWKNDPAHGEYYQSKGIGQEFVIEETPIVETWAKSLIEGV
jgi:hypothetical protein